MMCLSSVRSFAIQSRVFVLILQAFFNCLIPDHDAKVFNPPSRDQPKLGDRIVDTVLGGFRRWDAIYFLHIAEHGYTYENTLAFFPLFPLLVRLIANTVLFPLQYCMSYASVLLVSAVLFNMVCFVLSAMTLFKLGQRVLGNYSLAYRATQLYCVNPASVFFSAAYSESCFALLAFHGMLATECKQLMMGACYIALSGSARSNGLVNIGFMLHRTVKDGFRTLSQVVSTGQKNIVYYFISLVCYVADVATSHCVCCTVCCLSVLCLHCFL
jgi:phosphatidylinositol glycan class V